MRSRAARGDLAATVALALALGVLCGRFVHPGSVFAQIDIAPITYPLTLLQKTWLAWATLKSPFGAYGIPTFSVYYLLCAALDATVGPSVAQAAIVWLWLAGGSLGAFALARALRADTLSATVAAVVYVGTAFTLFLVAWTTGAAAFAVLPWIVLGLLVAAEPRHRRAVRFASIVLATTVFPTVASTPPLLFELSVVGAVVATAVCARVADRRSYLAWLVATIALMTVAAAWWLVPTLVAVGSEVVAHSVTASASTTVFVRASLLNALRFNTAWTWGSAYYLPFSVAYDRSWASYASDFFPAFAFGLALAVARPERRSLVRFAVLWSLVALFVVKGPHPPLAAVDEWLYRVPGFFLLIEPGGLMIAAILGSAVCAALVAERLPRVARAGFAGCAVVAALCALRPLVTTEYFHDGSTGAPPWYVRVPPAWEALRTALLAEPSNAAVLVLPPNYHYQAQYTWGFKGVDLIPATYVPQPSMTLGTGVDYLSERRTKSINDELTALLRSQSPRFADAARRVGFRFVLCRSDDVPAAFNDCTSGVVQRLLDRYAHRTFGALRLYDLGPTAGVAAVRAAATPIVPAPTDVGSQRHVYLVDRRPSAAPIRIDAEPLPTVVEIGLGAVVVTNPAYRTLPVDVVVQPLPATPQRATLTVGSRIVTADVEATGTRLRFRDVRLAPGTTDLHFGGIDDIAPSALPMLVHFVRLPQGRSARVDPAGPPYALAVAPDARRHVVLGGMPVRVALAREPVVEVTGVPIAGTSLGLVITARVGRARYACDVSTVYTTTLDLRDSLSACFDQNSVAVDVRRVEIARIDLDYMLEGALATATVRPSVGRLKLRVEPLVRHPSFVRANAPTMPALSERSSAAFPASLVDVPPPARDVLETATLYAPSWIAIRLTPAPVVLAHRELDGWRNGWQLGGPGPVVIVECLSIVQCLAMTATIVLIAWSARAWLRPRRTA